MATILGLFFVIVIAALVWKFACTVIGWLWAQVEEIVGCALVGGFIFWIFSWGIILGFIIGAIVGLVLRLKEVF